MNRHWTEDDFVAKIYGLETDNGHLEECATCREGWAGFQARRRLVLASMQEDVPVGVLAAQRRAVMARIGSEHGTRVKRLIPVLAAAGAVALGLFLTTMPHSGPPDRPQQAAVEKPMTDAQLFQETAAIGQSAEPRGAKPIEGLFQE